MKVRTTASLTRSQHKGSAVRGLIAAVLVVAQGLTLTLPAAADARNNKMSYSELLQKVDSGQVSKVEIDPTQRTAKVMLKKGRRRKKLRCLNSTKS